MPKKKLPYYDRKGYAYVYVRRQPVSLKVLNGRRCKTGTPRSLLRLTKTTKNKGTLFHVE